MGSEHLQVDTLGRWLDNATGVQGEVRVADINLRIIIAQIISKVQSHGST